MRVVCISDTHGYHDQINLPEGDLLIHSGDATLHGNRKEAEAFALWWYELPYKHKIFVAGNHDWLWQRNTEYANLLVHSLHDEATVIEGLKVWGASWQPWFFDWAFNLKRGQEIAAKWALIPDDTDILITHGPPYLTLDEVKYKGPVGCEDLAVRVRDIKPKLHVFGHIHEGYGIQEGKDTTFVNAAICDTYYDPINKPIVIDLDSPQPVE